MKNKPPETKQSKRNLPYRFTDAELLQIGKDLAEKTENLSSLENQKKQVTAEFGAKIAAAEAEISISTNKLRSGYEYRPIPVTEHLGVPEPDRKQIVRNDTNEIVGTEMMTPQEMQRELLAEKAPKEEDAKKEPATSEMPS